MLLVEFASKSSAEEMLLSGGSINTSGVPVRSPFFQFNKNKSKLNTNVVRDSQQLTTEACKRCKQIEMPKLFRENILNHDELENKLASCDSVSFLPH